MATKYDKKVLPKGQRLGWTPIKDVQHVVVSTITFRGKRVVAKIRKEAVPTDSLLIP